MESVAEPAAAEGLVRYTARLLNASLPDGIVALDGVSFFGGRQETIYARYVAGHWILPSCRRCTRKMLDAIDCVPGIHLRKDASS